MRPSSGNAMTACAVLAAVATMSCAGSDSIAPDRPIGERLVVTVSPRLDSIDLGGSTQLVARVHDGVGAPRDVAVLWSSANPAVASVSPTGLVSGVAPGTARVIAAVSGDTDTATVVVRDTPLSIQVTPNVASIGLGLTLQLSVLAGGSGAAVSNVQWSSADDAVATISADGVVSTMNVGETMITARVGDGSSVAYVRVTPNNVASVSLSPTNSTLLPGETLTLEATPRDENGRPLSNRPVKWSSSNTGLASVSNKGVVTGKAKGTVIITAESDGKSASATTNVTDVPAASVTVALGAGSLSVGATTTATATLRDAAGNVLTGRTVAWQSSNPSIATVTSSGLVTAIALGPVTITAISDGKSGSAPLTVVGSTPTSIVITPATAAMVVGQTAQLTAEVKDATGRGIPNRSITWSSSVPAVATVNANGLVTSLSVGSTTIRATADGLSATAALAVTPVAAASITITPESFEIGVGSTKQLAAVVKDAAGATLANRAVSWSSANPTVVTVSASGLVTAVGGGVTTIRATTDGVSATSSVEVPAPPPPPPTPIATITVTLASSNILTGQTTQATAVARDAAGNVLTGRAISWSSADVALATVSGTGLVTAKSAGSATIIATAEGQTGAATLTIAAPPPNPVATVTVTATATSLTVGQTSQVTVVLKDAGGAVLTGRTIGLSSSNTTVATISLSGLVTARAGGNTTITATSEGKTGTLAMTVAAATPPPPAPVATVTTLLGSSSLQVGQTTQATTVLRDASGNVLTGRTVTWASSNTAVATVNTSGVVSAIGAGSASINATSEGKVGSAALTVTAPATPPPPPPPPTIGTGAEGVKQLLGPLATVTASEALGGSFRTYEQNFRTYSDQLWASQGAQWDVANYYDRAMIYLGWWARTGNTTYRDRGSAIAINYRDNYLVGNQYNTSSFWSMLTGVALHYIATGDEASRRTVGYSAEWLSSNLYFQILGGHGDGIENRTRARVLLANSLAHAINAPQGGPATYNVGVYGGQTMTWKARAKAALDRILAAQGADGSWKDESNCYYAQPFMDALLMDAMTVYYRVVEADPRIVTAVKKTADYMWSRNWLGPGQGFIYIEGTCVFAPTGEVSSPGPTPPLTLMFPAFYAWLSKVTGDPKYMGWADIMFTDGVPTATYEYGKQFNQAFESSFRYVGFKLGAP